MPSYSTSILILVFGFSFGNSSEVSIAIKNPFENLKQVSENLYRSEQPKTKGFMYLEEQRFRTIINLRERQKDLKYADDRSFIHVHYPIRTWRLDESDILQVMSIIKASEGKILIHCKHGSDRTGCMIAAYRVIFEDWSKEKALAELRADEFGYHEFWFPDIAKLIENLDVEKMRFDLGISK